MTVISLYRLGKKYKFLRLGPNFTERLDFGDNLSLI
jgi:hypothetical protein